MNLTVEIQTSTSFPNQPEAVDAVIITYTVKGDYLQMSDDFLVRCKDYPDENFIQPVLERIKVKTGRDVLTFNEITSNNFYEVKLETTSQEFHLFRQQLKAIALTVEKASEATATHHMLEAVTILEFEIASLKSLIS